MTKRLCSDERGWALVTALILMTIMMGVGLTTFSYVDQQGNQSRIGRTRETAFNLAEAALNAQLFALSREWAGKGLASNPYAPCTQASVSNRCPSAANLYALFPGPDTMTGATWRTEVRDNGTSTTQNFYSDAFTSSQLGYDKNADGKLWVRAEARAKGRTRTLVALVKAEEQPYDIPHATVVANRVDNTNSGNKVLINTTGGGMVAVRCDPDANVNIACLGQPKGSNSWNKVDDQISPFTVQTSYPPDRLLNADQLAGLKATAIANGTYYATCPASPPTGSVVYIETGACSYTSNTVVNSSANPGMWVLGSGTLYFGGTVQFYGVIYAANLNNSSGNMVEMHGNAQVFGGVIVEGAGVLYNGSSKENIVFDDHAYNSVKAYSAAGIIQNTWREIKSTQ
jgi:Tfp pilus assembly protein PilX